MRRGRVTWRLSEGRRGHASYPLVKVRGGGPLSRSPRKSVSGRSLQAPTSWL